MPAHGVGDAIDVLTREHRRVREMIVTVIALPPADRRRRYVVAKVITELVRHAAVAERHLYPAVRAHVPDGDRLAAEKLAAHARTRRTIGELNGLDPSDARFDQVFRRLAGTAQDHLRDEETDLFPRLAGACDPRTLRNLGADLERARRDAPGWPCEGVLERADAWLGGLDGRPGAAAGGCPVSALGAPPAPYGRDLPGDPLDGADRGGAGRDGAVNRADGDDAGGPDRRAARGTARPAGRRRRGPFGTLRGFRPPAGPCGRTGPDGTPQDGRDHGRDGGPRSGGTR